MVAASRSISLLPLLLPVLGLCFLHVLIGGCTSTHSADRLHQQRSAGLYLEWHLEGWCDGSVHVYADTFNMVHVGFRSTSVNTTLTSFPLIVKENADKCYNPHTELKEHPSTNVTGECASSFHRSLQANVCFRVTELLSRVRKITVLIEKSVNLMLDTTVSHGLTLKPVFVTNPTHLDHNNNLLCHHMRHYADRNPPKNLTAFAATCTWKGREHAVRTGSNRLVFLVITELRQV